MKVVSLILAALLLSACGTKPFTITKNNYIPLTINSEFKDKNKCPYPQKDEFIKERTDLEGSDYMLAGYKAYICEHDTRMKIIEQTDKQAKDIENRNKK